MLQFQKFIPFTKVDAVKREVYGVVTSQVKDSDGERCDYETSKEFYKAWSDKQLKLSKGKSKGNIREMHQPSAVGKAVDLVFDDENKQILMRGKIVDDDCWKKCSEGVYTGFSHGGRYAKVWEDGGETWYTAKPIEVSVVDVPSNPEADFVAKMRQVQFEYVAEDGSTEMRKFKPEDEAAPEILVKIVNAIRDLRAEVKEIRGQSRSSAAVLPTARLVKASEIKVLRKSMYDVASLAQCLTSAGYLRDSSYYEREREADESEVPERLTEWLREGVDILVEMAEEEGSELTEARN